MALTETEFLKKYKHEKWYKKWGEDLQVHDFATKKSLIYDFENDKPNEFIQAVIDKKLSFSWHHDEQSIYMPPWEDIKNGVDDSCGEITELPGTDWSYFVVDFANWCRSFNYTPHEKWPAYAQFGPQMFYNFAPVAVKHILRLSNKKTDDDTIAEFYKKHNVSWQPGFQGTQTEGNIQFGGYKIDYRGSSDLAIDACPGLKILIGIKTSVLKKIPNDAHLLGRSKPVQVKISYVDLAASIIVQVKDIENDFDQMAKLFEYYAKKRTESAVKLKITPGDLDLKDEADKIRSFGKALKAFVDKKAAEYAERTEGRGPAARINGPGNIIEIVIYKDLGPDVPVTPTTPAWGIAQIITYHPVGEYKLKGQADDLIGFSATIMARLDNGVTVNENSALVNTKTLEPVSYKKDNVKLLARGLPGVTKRTLAYVSQLHGYNKSFKTRTGFHTFDPPNNEPSTKIDTFIKDYTKHPSVKIEPQGTPKAVLVETRKTHDSNPIAPKKQREALQDRVKDPNWHKSYLDFRKGWSDRVSDNFFQDIPKKPKRLRLHSQWPYLQDVYAEVLNHADTQRLTRELLRCLSPDSWLEILCHWIFKQGDPSLDVIIEHMQKTGLLDLIAGAGGLGILDDFYEAMEDGKKLKDSDLKALKLERDEYQQERNELYEASSKLQKKLLDLEMTLDNPTTPEGKGYAKQIKEIEEKIEDIDARIQLVAIDEAIIKKNASAGTYIPLDEGNLETPKKINRELHEVIANLDDPQLKDKVCREIIGLSYKAVELLRQLSEDDKEKSKESPPRRRQKNQKNKSEKRDKKPTKKKKQTDSIADIFKAALNQLAAQVAAGIVLYGVKKLLQELIDACEYLKQLAWDAVLDDENADSKIPGLGSFKDLLADNPESAAAEMAEVLDDYGLAEKPSIDDLLGLMESLEILLSQVELCGLFFGKPSNSVLNIVKNLIQIRYESIAKTLTQGDGGCITDAAIIDFFSSFKDYIDTEFCENLGSSADKELDFGVCGPMPNILNLCKDLLEGTATPEQIDNICKQASMDHADLIDWAIDTALSDNPSPPPAFCGPGEKGLLPPDPHPIDYLNDVMLDQIFKPLEANFRTDFATFLDRYMKHGFTSGASTALASLAEDGITTEKLQKAASVAGPTGGLFLPTLYDALNDPQNFRHWPHRLDFFDAGVYFGTTYRQNSYEFRWSPWSTQKIILTLDASPSSDFFIQRYSPTSHPWHVNREPFYSWFWFRENKIFNASDIQENRYLYRDLTPSLLENFTTIASKSIGYQGGALKVGGIAGDKAIMTKSSPSSTLFAATLISQMTPQNQSTDFLPLFSDLYDKVMTLDIIENMALTLGMIVPFTYAPMGQLTSQKSFWTSTNSLGIFFNKMIPKKVYSLDENCHPKNDSSALKVGQFKNHAKNRNNELSCKAAWDMTNQPSPLAVSTGEGLILALIRLYAFEMALRVLPITWQIDLADCFKNDATVEHVIDKIIRNLIKIDKEERTVTEKALEKQKNNFESADVEIEYFTDGQYGGYYTEKPPIPAEVPPLGQSFIPKYHSHVLQVANNIMTSRAEKGGDLQDPLSDTIYEIGDFKDPYNTNGIKYIFKEQIKELSEFFKEGLQSIDVYNSPLHEWWLRRLEGMLGFEISEEFSFFDYMPISNTKRYKDHRGRFYNAEVISGPGADDPDNLLTSLNIFLDNSVELYKNGNFILEPYIRVKQINPIQIDSNDENTKIDNLFQFSERTLAGDWTDPKSVPWQDYVNTLEEGWIYYNLDEFADIMKSFWEDNGIEVFDGSDDHTNFFMPWEYGLRLVYVFPLEDPSSSATFEGTQDFYEWTGATKPDSVEQDIWNNFKNNIISKNPEVMGEIKDEYQQVTMEQAIKNAFHLREQFRLPFATTDVVGASPSIYSIPIAEANIPINDTEVFPPGPLRPNGLVDILFFTPAGPEFTSGTVDIRKDYPKDELFELLINNATPMSTNIFLKNIFNLEAVLACFTLCALDHSYTTGLFEFGIDPNVPLDKPTKTPFNIFDSTKKGIRTDFYITQLAQDITFQPDTTDVIDMFELYTWGGDQCGSGWQGMLPMLGMTFPPDVEKIASTTPLMLLQGMATMMDPWWCKGFPWGPWTPMGWIMKLLSAYDTTNWFPPYAENAAEEKICPDMDLIKAKEEEEEAKEKQKWAAIVGFSGEEEPASYDGHGGMLNLRYPGGDESWFSDGGYRNRAWRYLKWEHLHPELQARWYAFEAARMSSPQWPEPPPFYNDITNGAAAGQGAGLTNVDKYVLDGYPEAKENGPWNFWMYVLTSRLGSSGHPWNVTPWYQGDRKGLPKTGGALKIDTANWLNGPILDSDFNPTSANFAGQGNFPSWNDIKYPYNILDGIVKADGTPLSPVALNTDQKGVGWSKWFYSPVGTGGTTGGGFEYLGHKSEHSYPLFPTQYLLNRHWGRYPGVGAEAFWPRNSLSTGTTGGKWPWRWTYYPTGNDIAEYIWYMYALGLPTFYGIHAGGGESDSSYDKYINFYGSNEPLTEPSYFPYGDWIHPSGDAKGLGTYGGNPLFSSGRHGYPSWPSIHNPDTNVEDAYPYDENELP